MSQRTHYGTTSDGVRIGGRVHGQGPPLVFWHGAYGDGDLDWQALLPHLTDQFTCHLPSWRGRGLSEDHPDLSYRRRVDDVLAYVESLQEPTGLVGWSGGASPVLAAAAESDVVQAVAPFEPTIGSVMDDRDRTTLGEAVTRMGELTAEGRLADALRATARFPFNDDEMVAAEEAGYFEAAGRYVPNLLDVFRQLMEHEGPTADDPALLGAICSGSCAARGRYQGFLDPQRPSRGRSRSQRQDSRDSQRRARCPPHPSRGPRQRTRRVLLGIYGSASLIRSKRGPVAGVCVESASSETSRSFSGMQRIRGGNPRW